MKKLIWLALLCSAWSQVTVIGTISDPTSGGVATSGYVQFDLQPASSGVQYYVAGGVVLAPQTAQCGINASGQVKNLALSGACQVWGVDVITPANLTYCVTFAPNNVVSNRVCKQLIVGTTYNLNAPVFGPVVNLVPQYATYTTNGTNNNIVPIAPHVFTVGTSGTPYAAGYFDNLVITNSFIIPNLIAGTATFNGLATFNAALNSTSGAFSGTVTSSSSAVTNAGVFTNTQQNDYLTSILGTLSFGTRYSTQQGGNFATEAIAGGVQCSGTVHQCNGVAGYVQSTSTTPYPVALYGQAEIGIAGGKAYGSNTVTADTASLSGTLVGGEDDINVNNAASTVVGRSLQGVFAAQPTSANAYNFGKPTGGHWQNGLVFNGGFTNNGCFGGGTCGIIVINQSSTGAGQDSQQILFNSSAQSSVLRLLDSNGFLFHNIGYTAPIFSSSGVNPAASGTIRLVKTEAIGWRNNANSGDNLLGQDSNNHLTFAGLTVAQMTVTLKSGSGAGNYTASNTSYANVDTTNLCSVVTIPVGSKLIINAVGTGLTSTAAVNFLVSIADIGTTCGGAGTTPLQEVQLGAVSTSNPTSYALAWVVNGDGAAHAISMQAKTTAGADSWVIANSSTTLRPSMILTLTPSN